MRPALLVPVLLLPLLLAGCDSPDCVKTTMTVNAAGKVDLRGIRGSSVLTGALVETESGDPVPGADVTVTLTDNGDDLYRAATSTSSGGKVSYDLKGRLSVDQTLALARADGFGLSFSGTDHYCSSADEATFRLVRA